MSIERDSTGRFRNRYPDGDAFVTISNEKIYEAIVNLDKRVGAVETRVAFNGRIMALVMPSVTAVTSVVATFIALRH